MLTLRPCVFAAMLLVATAQPIGGGVGMRSKFGSEGTQERPVAKVINLLKDMQAQLEKEGEADQEAFDAYACWCDNNDKEKTKNVADGEQHTEHLTALIQELTAKSGQLREEIASLKQAVAKGKDSLDEAMSVRDQELAEFNKEDKDAIVAVQGLHGAVTTLSKHQGAALSQEVLLQVRNAVTRHTGKHAPVLASSQKRFVASFLQESAGLTFRLKQPSGEIFGVLQAMKENFETNQANSRTEENKAAEDFANMKKAKTAELAAARKQLDAKQAGLAKTDESNANAKSDLKDATAALAADRKLLSDLKSRCSSMDQEWANRQKMRQDEVASISEALKILTEDDARDVTTRSTNLVQASSLSRSLGRNRAAGVLMAAAEKLGNPQLSLLAISMKSDVFDKIKLSIDDMIKQLKQEGKDEVKHKDWCMGELHENDMHMDDKYHDKKKLDTRHADLDSAIKKATEDITVAKKEIAEMQIEMKKASENRAKESKEFEMVIADSRATIDILNKAVAKLQSFYDRGSALLAVETTTEQEPPPSLKPYVKAGGGGVIATIQGIISESRKVKKEALFNNHESQMAYEEFMRDANKSISMLNKEIVDKTNQMGSDQADLARTEADLGQNTKDLEGFNQVSEELHANCDRVTKNFEKLQSARTAEIDALVEAKVMMSQA